VVVVIAGVATAGSWRYVEPRGGLDWVRERVSTFVTDSDTTYAGEGTTRLISMNTGRPPLWREAVQQSRATGALGTGANTFVFTHERFRDGGVVKHAHSQWFNVLSELGFVGLGLFVAAIALILVAAVRNPFSDRGDAARPLVVALQAGLVAFVVHMSWDWDWDMAAVGAVFFLFAATCATYLDTRRAEARHVGAVALADGRPPDRFAGGDAEALVRAEPDQLDGTAAARADAALRPYRDESPGGSHAEPSAARPGWAWPLRAAATTALVLLAVSWLFPYLSLRAQSAAIAAAGQGRLSDALSGARRAAALDPLAVDPLLTEASVLQQLGRNSEALAVLRSAQRLQPDNHEPYYREGRLLLTAFDDRKAAIAALKHALALNPQDRAARYELEQAVRR
jgi:hypothetical protein